MAVDEKQLTEDILRLAATDVRRCMQCGRCSANCEAASKMDLLPPLNGCADNRADALAADR